MYPCRSPCVVDASANARRDSVEPRTHQWVSHLSCIVSIPRASLHSHSESKPVHPNASHEVRAIHGSMTKSEPRLTARIFLTGTQALDFSGNAQSFALPSPHLVHVDGIVRFRFSPSIAALPSRCRGARCPGELKWLARAACTAERKSQMTVRIVRVAIEGEYGFRDATTAERAERSDRRSLLASSD